MKNNVNLKRRTVHSYYHRLTLPFLFLIAGIAALSSCGSNKFKRHGAGISDSAMTIHAKSGLSGGIKKTATHRQTGKFRIDSCSSPAGLVIDREGPDEVDAQFYFFRDHRLINRYNDVSALAGNWELRDSIIMISYTRRYYKHGIGKPLPSENDVPGYSKDEYERYQYMQENIDQRDSCYWNEIKKCISDSLGLYELVSHNLREYRYNALLDLNVDQDDE